jgi:hypothetical protein
MKIIIILLIAAFVAWIFVNMEPDDPNDRETQMT